jgi:hypothetical protein
MRREPVIHRLPETEVMPMATAASAPADQVPRSAWVVPGFLAAMLAIPVLLHVSGRSNERPSWADVVALVVIPLSFSLAGAIIVRREPRNRYGGLAKRAVTLKPGSLAGKAPRTAQCLGCIVRRADPAPISFWLRAGQR